jgi:putative ABC transport system ATP-binding protein
MANLIELKDVNKVYNSEEVKFQALSDINLEIKKGEFLAVIGPSGSGKSTLLHILGLLDKPTSGKMIFEDKDISKLSDPEIARLRGGRIGFVFQFFNLYPQLTAEENIELPMMILDKDKNERKKKSLELLKLVNLENRKDHVPSQLSGGERQRVAIARALANDSDIILADEPTGNLDTKSSEQIIKILEELNSKFGKTVIIITHAIEIANYAKNEIFLKDGKIVKKVIK